jgi:pilus assembly protein CpaF
MNNNSEERQQRLRETKDRLRTLSFSRLVSDRVMSAEQSDMLVDALRTRKTIVVTGTVGSGKTTLQQALANEQVRLFPDGAIALIEDPEELQCSTAKHVRYVVTEDLPAVHQMRRAVREGSHRIVFGEIRTGVDVAELLACVAYGVSGTTTLYAKSLDEVVGRLTSLLGNSTRASTQELVEKIDVVVFMGSDEVRVQHVVRMADLVGR